MSEFSFSIELIYKTFVKQLASIPRTIKDLQSLAHSSFSISGVAFKYMDEEGDLITISSDKELLESYQVLKELQVKNFKITVEPSTDFKSNSDSDLELDENYIKTVKGMVRNEIEKSIGYEKPGTPVWKNVTCDGCNELPITGIRFKCTVCDNFDLCEYCEMTEQHPHPFLKLTSLDHGIDFLKASLEKPDSSFKKHMIVKKPKMKFVQHVNYIEGEKVRPGQVMEKIWRIKNCGNDPWPLGCKLQSSKGDLNGTGYELGPVASGETVDAVASINIPNTEGRYTGVWRLFTPCGTSFGDKLYIVVQSLNNEEIPEKNVGYLMELGFTRDNSVKALKLFPGDLQSAVKYLVNNSAY